MDKSGLVALVYRADWTQLSLSATIWSTFDPEVDERLSERKAAEARRLTGVWPRVGQSRPRPYEHDDEDDEDEDDDDFTPRDAERRVLLAPGGRCRIESSNGYLTLSDGGQSWVISPPDDEEDDDASEVVAHRLRHAITPGEEFRGLLTPRWLIACYDLEISGEEAAGSRTAIRVTGTPRSASGRRRGRYDLLDRVEVLVDAELGILLRSAQILAGQTRESAELRDLVVDPAGAADASMFTPPPGLPVEDEKQPFADFEMPTGPGWQAAGAAAGVAAKALGFAARNAPRKKTAWPTDDEEPDMPADASLSPQEWERGEPVDDRLVNLLHRTGLPAVALTADLHQWRDTEVTFRQARAVAAKIPEPFAGLLGPDALWDSGAEWPWRDAGGHRVARLAIQMPGRYRLDYLTGDWRQRYQAIACDGEHTTKLFSDRVATGPAKPLDRDIPAMLDPAWLLRGWRLTVPGSVSVAGREGIRVLAVPTGDLPGWALPMARRADLVVDAELGVLLRHTTYIDGQPATRTELRVLRPDAGTTSFRIEPEPGMRAVTDSGSPLADLNLPGPADAATAAATTAAALAAGAVAVTGWLDKHRKRRDQH